MTFNGLRRSKLYLTATGAVLAGGVTSAQASQIHTVRAGDNLSTIARKYKVTIQDIIQANHLTNRDALSLGRKLTIPETPRPVVAAATMRKAATIHGDRISVRIGPDVTCRRVDMFDMGAPLTVTASNNGWFQVVLPDGRQGWVRNDYVKLTGSTVPLQKVAAVARKAASHATSPHVAVNKVKLKHAVSHHPIAKVSHEAHRRHTGRNHFASASHASHRKSRAAVSGSSISSENDVVRTAVAYRGTPYHYGGTGRSGFDCSGFTSYVYRQKGVALPHNAAAQYTHGTKVDKSEMKPGDLVFFHCGRRGISHVGIFVGNGKFVHASSPHSGGVRVDSLSDGYYKSTFRGARRVKK